MSYNRVQSIQDSLKERLRHSDDVVYKEFHTKEKYLETLYIKTVSDATKLQDLLIKPFFEILHPENFLAYLQSHPSVRKYENEDKTMIALLKGVTVLFYQDTIFILEINKVNNNTVIENSVETTIQGPQQGFSESIDINIGLIRHRYPAESLFLEPVELGSISQTSVMVLYDSKKVNQKTLEEVRKLLSSIDIEMFQSGEQLLDFTKKTKRVLFPTIMVTERPDRVAVNLAAGKVILLISGSPFAVLMPTVMKDLMASMEDIYQTYWIGLFLLILRYFGLLTSVLLPALYVAMASYNPEILRVQLALSVAGSRSVVPYPSFVEVIIMLLMMELLMEASVRLPKAIGSTATTVGGLILGQAATEAGLVSNIMIIIVSLGAIANFVIPISIFSFSIRVCKYLLLLFSIFFGLVGVVLGLFLIIAYMVSLDSFGTPFLTLTKRKSTNNKLV